MSNQVLQRSNTLIGLLSILLEGYVFTKVIRFQQTYGLQQRRYFGESTKSAPKKIDGLSLDGLKKISYSHHKTDLICGGGGGQAI
jgi:hypothetical protein